MTSDSANRDLALQLGSDRKGIAAAGERLATEYLQKQGHELIERNWHSGRFGEIDIILRHNDLIVFVEVKTRKVPLSQSDLQMLGFEDITWRKRQKIVIAARSYLARKRLQNASSRIDVMVVTYTACLSDAGSVRLSGVEFTHVPGAFCDV